MKILAINGSSRKNRNTATILRHGLDGAIKAAPAGDELCEII